MWTRDNLLDLIHCKLQGYRFILVSHREPYIHQYAGGGVECEQPASGLTVAEYAPNSAAHEEFRELAKAVEKVLRK